MSEEPLSDSLVDLARPEPPLTWGERMAGWAESLDLTPTRLAVGIVVLAVGGFVAWRLLAPPPLPPEMQLPFASTSVAPAAAGGQAGSAGSGAGGTDGPDPAAGAAGGGVDGGRSLEVVVHVAGAVRTPGVQRLESDARVIDAVDAAGGPTGEADLARINLAALLQDGQQVYVPRIGEPVPPMAAGAAGAAGGATGDSASPASGGAPGTPSGPVNLNQASLEELEELPGVGPAIAQAIIDHREQQGPFTTVEQLLDVRGIGDARFADLQDLVTV